MNNYNVIKLFIAISILFAFTTASAQAPTATTGPATGVGSTSAMLNGTVNANGSSTIVVFEYGLTTEYGTFVTADQNPVTGSTNTAVSGTIFMGLDPGTTYHYRVAATNASGTTYGTDMTFTTLMTITVAFTNGSTFTPTITPGSTNQAIGRFKLAGVDNGSYLAAAMIKLNGTRTGLNNFKLWSSTDAGFNAGSDTQLGSTVAVDPGAGSSVAFSGFSSAISDFGGTSYYLTADVSSNPTGTVRGVIVQNSDLTLSNGIFSTVIINDPLSSGDIPLPVGLVSFSAHSEGRSVILNWITESEVDNLGFILQRSVENDQWVEIASYLTHESLKGRGNTSSRTEYFYTDVTVESGMSYAYRLSDVSTTGKITVHPSLSVKLDGLPEVTGMSNAYPNPFNPRTYISYNLKNDTRVKISVFDMLGRFVKTLHDDSQRAGSYHVFWNGTNETGVNVSSGMYIIRMHTDNVSQVQKVMLIR